MASLTGSTIASSYLTLLKLTSAALGADASAKYIEDAAGTDSALSISTTRVGIGTASPDRSLHVSTGSAGTVTGNANAPLVLETAGDTNIQLLAPNTSDEFILFGSNSGNRTYIQVDLSATAANESFQIYTNSALAFKLDSNSRISLSNNDSGGTGGTDSTSANTVLGYLAGANIASGGLNNSVFGHKAGNAITTGDENVSVGALALDANQTGGSNVAVGASAAGAFIGSYAVAIGREALRDANHASTADGTVAIGTGSLASLTSGAKNISIGFQALQHIDTAQDNIAIGYQAMSDQNVGGGGNAADSDRNIAIGTQSMNGAWADAKSEQNVALGSYTMQGAMNGASYNTVVGDAAGNAITSGDSNTLIGYASG